MIPVALLCVTASGCADQQATDPILARPSREMSLAYNHVFVAWSENYSASPAIQMQLFSLDARQDRQFVDFYVTPAVLAFARANPGRLYIDGDEPDQYCVAPYDYAGTYHDFVAQIQSADPTARFSPAGFAEPNYKCCPEEDLQCYAHKHSASFADQFYNAYVQRYGVAPRVDEWRLHDFGLGFRQGDIDGWWDEVSRMAAWSEAHGAHMVLASWGFMGWREDAAAYQEHMKQAMGRIMNDPRIVGAVYWSYQQWLGNPHYLVNADGSLTPEGQTYMNPLTDIPTAVTTSASTNHATLQWTNTTAAWAAETEFWVQSPGSSSFVYRSSERIAGPGASQTSVAVFNVGEVVKGRVRYYNPFGVGDWSAFSNPVVMEAGQQGSTPKSPLPCFSSKRIQTQPCQ